MSLVSKINLKSKELCYSIMESFIIFIIFKHLKAVCHVSDLPQQSELNTTDFFVNLTVCLRQRTANRLDFLRSLTFYGR